MGIDKVTQKSVIYENVTPLNIILSVEEDLMSLRAGREVVSRTSETDLSTAENTRKYLKLQRLHHIYYFCKYR